jgi:nitrate/TMAO reductase-like tetraheme cytochrome c subunit
MKIFFLVFILGLSLYGAKVVEIEERFQKSQSCKACHMHIVKDWEKSWHAKSHYNSDEYFKATIDYVSRKTRKSLNGVKVQCATCHNPRISVTSTGMDYEIAAVMDLDKGSAVNKALASDSLNEGINCVVCHNIDKIHTNADDTKRGIHRVEWTKSGVMSGPYDDTKSPYHKVKYKDFMDNNSEQLCFVCHANDRSVSGMVFTNMEDEFKKGDKSCVDCHMGEKKLGIASTLKIDNGKARERMVRGHGFEGAHTDTMWKDALDMSIWEKGDDLYVTLKNPQPHNIPSGFGSRELIIDLSYKVGLKVIDTKSISLTRHYTSKRKKPTIPHLAVKASKDMSVPANGSKSIKVKKVEGATSIEAKLYYRLVNDEVRGILDLKDPIWSKKSFINSAILKLK